MEEKTGGCFPLFSPEPREPRLPQGTQAAAPGTASAAAFPARHRGSAGPARRFPSLP